jgi:hypothetical protein
MKKLLFVFGSVGSRNLFDFKKYRKTNEKRQFDTFFRYGHSTIRKKIRTPYCIKIFFRIIT